MAPSHKNHSLAIIYKWLYWVPGSKSACIIFPKRQCRFHQWL